MLIRARAATIAGASPERQALAEAIAKSDAAAAELAAIRAAVATTTDKIFTLRDETEAARRALERAKVAATDHAIAEALGTAAAAPASVREARARELAAADALEAAEAARTALESRLADAEDEEKFQRQRVAARAREFVRGSPEVAALIERAAAVQAEYGRLADALACLNREAAISATSRPIEVLCINASAARAAWIREDDTPDGSQPWRAWLAELERNPNAAGPV